MISPQESRGNECREMLVDRMLPKESRNVYRSRCKAKEWLSQRGKGTDCRSFDVACHELARIVEEKNRDVQALYILTCRYSSGRG